MRVTWDKRYITLAPVCTLLGLAFRLYDPDGLLGDEKDLGITCALVPRPPRRGHGPPPLPAERHVHERPDARPGRVHAAGLHHRRPRHGRPGLAHADGMPGRRPLDLAAVLQHRHVQADRPRRGRLCPRAQPVPHTGGQVRGRRGSAGAHRRPHLHDGRRAQHDRRRGGPGRKALGRLRHRQIPRHRARAPGRQRRHGRDRRQGICLGPSTSWAAPTSRFPSASPWKAPTS